MRQSNRSRRPAPGTHPSALADHVDDPAVSDPRPTSRAHGTPPAWSTSRGQWFSTPHQPAPCSPGRELSTDSGDGKGPAQTGQAIPTRPRITSKERFHATQTRSRGWFSVPRPGPQPRRSELEPGPVVRASTILSKMATTSATEAKPAKASMVMV